MTAWTRVNILAWGYSEVEDIKLALVPHLATLQLHVSPIAVMASRKQNRRGGVTRYAKVKKFRLPTDFPGHSDGRELNPAGAKAECLERALADDIAQDLFIPYVLTAGRNDHLSDLFGHVA